MKKLISLCTAAVLCLTLLASCAPKPDSSSPSPSPDAEPVDLAAFAQSVQENHQFASLEKADPADEELGAIMLENNYPGLKDMDLEQTEVYLPMISFSGGELALVQAKSAEDAAKVKEIFQARVDAKGTDGPGNYPEEVEMWQRSAQVVENGNYIMLVCHDDADAIVEEAAARGLERSEAGRRGAQRPAGRAGVKASRRPAACTAQQHKQSSY